MTCDKWTSLCLAVVIVSGLITKLIEEIMERRHGKRKEEDRNELS